MSPFAILQNRLCFLKILNSKTIQVDYVTGTKTKKKKKKNVFSRYFDTGTSSRLSKERTWLLIFFLFKDHSLGFLLWRNQLSTHVNLHRHLGSSCQYPPSLVVKESLFYLSLSVCPFPLNTSVLSNFKNSIYFLQSNSLVGEKTKLLCHSHGWD